jgi:predicted nucleic acid-binding protein
VGGVYLDTSALVRRYAASEPGSARVRDLCEPSTGNRLLLCNLTRVEVASALGLKARRREIDAAERDALWSLFLTHLRDQYLVSDVDDWALERAVNLVCVHQLRAYDAVQLAVALRARSLVSQQSVLFCTADVNQAQAAASEGLDVELIGGR